MDLLGFGIVLPLLPLYAKDFGVSGAQIGILLASFSAMQFLFAPVWGRLSDRYGRRPLLMLGLAGSVASYTLFAFATSYSMLLWSRVAAGVFGATIGTAQAYIADVTGHADRGKQMALIGAAFGVGFTIGPAIGGLSHAYLGAMAPGLIAAGFSLLALLMAWKKLPEPERHVEGEERKLFDSKALRHAFATKTLPLILLLSAIATFCFANFEGTLALLMRERRGYPDIKATAFMFMYVGFCLLIAQGFIVRRFMGRVGEERFAVLGCLVLGGGLLGIALQMPPLAILPVAVLGFSMLSPSLSSLLSRRTPANMQGEILGLGQSGLALARIFGPYVGNVAFFVSPERPFWIAAAIMAVAFLMALRLLVPIHKA